MIAATGRNARHLSLAAIASALTLLSSPANAAVTLDLGTADGFAVLAGSGITVAGAVKTTTIKGDIGTFPTLTITGLENMVLSGVNHGGDSVTQLAKTDLTAAYIEAAGRTYTVLFSDAYDLVGMTLTSGVYNSPSSLFLSGMLTLDGQGDPNSVWIFQAGSTFTSASASQVNLIGGAKPENVFWQVGSSATLGTDSDFSGSILALHSITMTTGATLNGRALAMNGAVTMDNNSIVIPEPGSVLLLCTGLATGLMIRRRPGHSA